MRSFNNGNVCHAVSKHLALHKKNIQARDSDVQVFLFECNIVAKTSKYSQSENHIEDVFSLTISMLTNLGIDYGCGERLEDSFYRAFTNERLRRFAPGGGGQEIRTDVL